MSAPTCASQLSGVGRASGRRPIARSEVARVLGDPSSRAVAAGADDRLVAVAVDDRAVVDDEVLARAVADVAHADVVDPPAVAERALEHRGDTVGVEQRAHRGHGGVRRRRGAPAARDEALLGGEAPERARDLGEPAGVPCWATRPASTTTTWSACARAPSSG